MELAPRAGPPRDAGDFEPLADRLFDRVRLAPFWAWPLEPALRARLLLYVALPIGSWLGGALAERLLDALFPG